MKRWMCFFLALTCVAAVAVWALPMVVGSKWVYQPLVDRLAAEKFQLNIDEVRLGWLRPISFGKIEVSAPKDDLANQQSKSSESEASLVTVEAIRSDRSLLGFLWHGRNLGTVEIVNPNVDIRLLEDGTNLGRLIRAIVAENGAKDIPQSSQNPSKAPPMLDIQIVVRGFHVSVTDEQTGQPIMVVPPFDTAVSYKAIDVESHVTIAATKALDQVAITQELVHLGLAKAVPLLANSTEFDGRVSLESGPITIPLGHPQDATGNAVLTLHSVRTVPTDPTILSTIDFLGRLFKRQLPHELIFVDGSMINVEIANQTVKHDGVRAGLPQVDDRLQIATSGSVGLENRQLELGIEIPVPLEQLARRQSVKQLGVPSITLPIRGTLDKPVLDWDLFRQDSADLLSTMSNALSSDAPLVGTAVGALSEVAEGNADQAIATGFDLVEQWLQRRKQRTESQPETQAESDDEPSSDKKSGRPLRDVIKNIFRDR